MKKTHIDWLWANNACGVSLVWVKQHNIQSLEEAWNTCERGDWLLWMAQRLGIERHKLVLCGALCAYTVVQHMKDPRSREAVRVAFLWGRGKATDEQVDTAWGAASKAFYDAEMEANIWAARAAMLAIEAVGGNYASAAAASASWAVEAAGDDIAANQLRVAEIAKKLLTEDVLTVIKTIK